MEKKLFNIQEIYQTHKENGSMITPLELSEEKAEYINSSVNAGLIANTSVGQTVDFVSKKEVGLKNLDIQELFLLAYTIGIKMGMSRATREIFELGPDHVKERVRKDMLDAEEFFIKNNIELTSTLKQNLFAMRGIEKVDENSNINPFKKKDKGFDIPNN